MGRRRITPAANGGLNPAAAHVPSVLAAAAAAHALNPQATGGPSIRAPSSASATAAAIAAASALPQPATSKSTKRASASGNGNLTNHQRKIICEFYQKSGGVMSQKDLAQWTKHEFGLKKTPAQSTISGILRRQHEFINMSSLELGIKKRRVVQHPQLDNALANWVIQCAHRGITVQGDMTKEKAKHFAKMLGIPEEEQPEFSNGWLHSFQLRHNFSFRKFNGDALPLGGVGGGAPSAATPHGAADKRVIRFSTMEALVEETKKYELHNIFAMAELGVLYNLTPSLATTPQQSDGADDQLPEDPQLAKKRFVATFCCNASGTEKLQPLFVSHHEQPKCFKKKSAEQHSLQYFWNTKAWVTGVIFSKWLQRLDFAMASQKRHILLLLNEAPSHAVAHLELTNIVVLFLPEGMPSLNPMHNGVLATTKMRYRRHHLRHVIDRFDEGKKVSFRTNVLYAMKWATLSWDELSNETLARAWTLAQIVPDRLEPRADLHVNQEADTLDAELSHLLLYLRLDDSMPLSEFLHDEAKFENSIHEEFFEVVQTADEVPDDDVEDDGDDASAPNLTLQDKLRAFRDVLQVLKDRNDTESETALSTLRRVQDAIRSEVRQDTDLSSTMSIDAAAAGNGNGNTPGTLNFHALAAAMPGGDILSMAHNAGLMNAMAMQMNGATTNVGGREDERMPDADFHAVL
jgi:hypothetical protein